MYHVTIREGEGVERGPMCPFLFEVNLLLFCEDMEGNYTSVTKHLKPQEKLIFC